MGVAVRRLHLEDAVADFEHGNIERSAAQVIDGDLLVFLLVESVSKRRGCWFVDDSKNFETRDLARVFRRVSLRVIEVSRHGDHGLRHLLAQLRFRVGLEFRENHRGNFGGRESFPLTVHLDLDVRIAVGRLHDLIRHAVLFLMDFIELAAHETLD